MILFLDFETTGLPTASPEWLGQPGIVQVGAIRLRENEGEYLGDMQPNLSINGQPENEFVSLVNPEAVTWSEAAINVHGITPASVEGAPTFFEIGPALARFAMGCRAWGGYNCRFDKSVLWHQLRRYGLERNFPWPPEPDIDVMYDAAKVMEMRGKRGTKKPKLAEAYQFFVGREMSGAHDALSDIRNTVEVWRRMNADTSRDS